MDDSVLAAAVCHVAGPVRRDLRRRVPQGEAAAGRGAAMALRARVPAPAGARLYRVGHRHHDHRAGDHLCHHAQRAERAGTGRPRRAVAVAVVRPRPRVRDELAQAAGRKRRSHRVTLRQGLHRRLVRAVVRRLD